MSTHQSGDCDPDVSVDAEDPLVGVGLVQLRLDDLLDSEDDSVLAPQRHRRPRVVHGLPRVVDLEDAAVGGELRRVEVVPGADRRHLARAGLLVGAGAAGRRIEMNQLNFGFRFFMQQLPRQQMEKQRGHAKTHSHCLTPKGK